MEAALVTDRARRRAGGREARRRERLRSWGSMRGVVVPRSGVVLHEEPQSGSRSGEFNVTSRKPRLCAVGRMPD